MAAAGDLRLLTYNIRRDTRADGPDRWRHRRDRVAATLRDVDLAGLQEVKRGQLLDLWLQAPRHRFAGVGRADGRHAGEHVPVFWRADRWVLEAQGHFWLSRTPDVAGSRDHADAVTRMATWVRLHERWGRRRVFVLNTHLDHRVEAAHDEGAVQVRAAVDDLAGDLPVVVTGDLNAEPDSTAFATLVGPGHRVALHDAFALAPHHEGPEPTLNSWRGPRPGKRIDVVLLSEHWAVSAYRVDDSTLRGRFPSDHYPVVVEARIS